MAVLGIEEAGPSLRDSWLQRTARPGGEQHIRHKPVFGKYNTRHAAVSAMARQGPEKAVQARFVVAGSCWSTDR